MTATPHKARKIRHPIKTRMIEVIKKQLISPSLLSISFAGDTLDDFLSLTFDDHIKLFFPEPGETLPILPKVTAEGGLDFSAGRSIMRDFTPRKYSNAAKELEIQFVLHGDGPASTWAQSANVGDLLGIGGPKTSFIMPEDMDWLMLIGDQTAFPAIARCLDELNRDIPITLILKIEAADQKILFERRENLTIVWVVAANDSPVFAHTVRDYTLPTGQGFVWAAGEASSMQLIHSYLVDTHHMEKGRVRVSNYWKLQSDNNDS